MPSRARCSYTGWVRAATSGTWLDRCSAETSSEWLPSISAVTAMGQQAIGMEALRAGAKDFDLKPFQPDRVLGALNKLLAA